MKSTPFFQGAAMNVSLTPQLEKFVAQKVKSGMYSSASEVVRESLRLLNQQSIGEKEQLASLKKDIQRGLDDIKAGRVAPLDMKAIMAEGRARLAAKGARS